MLSSAISYASSKEKKREWRTEGGGGGGGEWERKGARMGESVGGESSGPQWDKQKLPGNKEAGAVRWGEGRFGCTASRAAACWGVTGDEGRFPRTHCSAARWLCCSVESNLPGKKGDGKGGGGGGGGEWGLVALMPKYSLPASQDVWGGDGQAAAVYGR